MFSQFSFVNAYPDHDAMKHGSLGYVLGTEQFAFDGNVLTETKRTNATIGSPENYLEFSTATSVDALRINYAPLSIPCLEFRWMCTGATEVLLDIYETGSKGFNSMREKPRGRTGKVITAQNEQFLLSDNESVLHPENFRNWGYPTNDFNVGFSARAEMSSAVN